jgi:hypothetical protein
MNEGDALVDAGRGARPSASELLHTDGALLTRTHLRELGLERRAIDAVFRTLRCVFLPGYSRPLVRASDYLDLLERSTYTGDCVRPTRVEAVMISGSRGRR